MKYIVIPLDSGYKTHKGSDQSIEKLNLPTDAEEYNEEDTFNDRISELQP